MLQEIMEYKGGALKREEALEILRVEASPKYFQDWPVLLMIVLYGIASFLLGTDFLMVFLFASTCLAMAMHRRVKRQSALARAVLSILGEMRGPESDSEPSRQDKEGQSTTRQ